MVMHVEFGIEEQPVSASASLALELIRAVRGPFAAHTYTAVVHTYSTAKQENG